MGEREPAARSARRLRFGAFELDTVAGELSYRGRRVRIQDVPLKVLSILIERPGELVRREEFFARIWPDDELGLLDGNLNMAVYKLRHALQDHAEHPAYIETIPRKGYRFLATVVACPDEAPARRPWVAAWGLAASFLLLGAAAAGWHLAGRAPPIMPEPHVLPGPRTVAVLPFANLGADPEQEYFGDGLAEEILNLLASSPELKVTGRTSSFAFRNKDLAIPEIGRALGVAYVLEGSVRRSGDRLRVTAQLIDTQNGFHLWSETFDRLPADVFAIQDEVAAAVAGKLKASIASHSQRQAVDPEVYDLYLQAVQKYQERDVVFSVHQDFFLEARALVDRALELEPEFAPALALSGTFALLQDPWGLGQARAQHLLERALELDSFSVDAYRGLGLLAYFRGDYSGARMHLARALELNPSHRAANHLYASTLGREGYVRESIAFRQRIAEIDPLFALNLTMLAQQYVHAGDFEGSLALARALQERFPDRPGVFRAEAWALLYHCRLFEARAAIERVREAGGLAVGDLERILYRRLADFARGDGQLGYFAVVAPVLAGEAETGLERGWQWIAAAPDSWYAATALMDALSIAGRHEELLSWVERRWPNVEVLRARFGVLGTNGFLMHLAAAQQATGQAEALEATLSEFRALLDFQREQGYGGAQLDYFEAGYHAVAGHREALLASLDKLADAEFCEPMLPALAPFAPWREDPDFQQRLARMLERVNVERALFGLEPLS